jgi:hypothetical protein
MISSLARKECEEPRRVGSLTSSCSCSGGSRASCGGGSCCRSCRSDLHQAGVHALLPQRKGSIGDRVFLHILYTYLQIHNHVWVYIYIHIHIFYILIPTETPTTGSRGNTYYIFVKNISNFYKNTDIYAEKVLTLAFEPFCHKK